MNKKTKYIYVLQPGSVSGAPFFTAYAMQDPWVGETESKASDHREPSEARGSNRSDWVKQVVRLPQVCRRWARQHLLRKPLGADAAA